MIGRINTKQIEGILPTANGGLGNATFSTNELIRYATQSFVSTGCRIDDTASATSSVIWTSDKIQPKYASCYFIANATATTTANTATYYKSAGVTTAGFLSTGFTMPVNNRLLWTGPSIEVVVNCNWSMVVATNNRIVRGVIYKNGVAIAETEAQSGYASAFSYANGTSTGYTTLNSGDFIEFYLRNVSNTSNVTTISMNLSIQKI